MARVTARRAFRVAARVCDSCPDEPRAPRALRRAGAVACERIVAVVAITERSVARVGYGYNPDGVARGAFPRVPAEKRRRRGVSPVFVGLSSRLGSGSARLMPLIITRVCQNSHAISARVLGLSAVQNARIKNRTRGRPSHQRHHLNTPESNQETEGSPHRARTTRASLARGNRLDGRICRRAPPGGRRRPPRVPRAPEPSTNERPPTARRVRASRESPGARRPGARVLRGRAGRRGRP